MQAAIGGRVGEPQPTGVPWSAQLWHGQPDLGRTASTGDALQQLQLRPGCGVRGNRGVLQSVASTVLQFCVLEDPRILPMQIPQRYYLTTEPSSNFLA